MLRTSLTHLRSRLARFRKEDEGSVMAEVVIMFPTLFAATIAIFVFFDAFRNQSINLKANYTIADAISRENNYISDTYMNTTWRLHRFLANSRTLTRLRVSVIRYDKAADDANDPANAHRVVWSQAKGGGVGYEDVDLSQIGIDVSEVPAMPDGEILIVVQTSVDYEPNFSIGFEAFTFENTTFTRPRWNPDMICYSSDGSDANRICPIGS